MIENAHECEICGDVFDSHKAQKVHEVHAHDDNTANMPWRDKERLQELYIDEGLSSRDIADKFDCGPSTILEWLDRHDIEIRSKGRHRNNEAKISLREGYETIQIRGIDGVPYTLRVHRAIMIAERGLDALKNNDVHHINGIPWDNRLDNLELVNRSDHSQKHHSQNDMVCITETQNNQVLSEDDVRRIRELWDEGGYTQTELADKFGTVPSHISRIVNRKVWRGV